MDGYDMANNQNLYAENEWDFHFRNHTVALYGNETQHRHHHHHHGGSTRCLDIGYKAEWRKYITAFSVGRPNVFHISWSSDMLAVK